MKLLSRRDLIAGTFATITAAKTARAARPKFDATVGKDGFASIQAALDTAPREASAPFRILIRSGVWREKLIVDKPFVHLFGEDRHRSVVSFDAYAEQLSPDGQPYGTFRTATITVRAPDFSASNLTIENSFDHLAFIAKTNEPAAGGNGAQAVALMLDAKSDRAFVSGCDLNGFQDTLFTNAGRSVFRNCRVSGTVDFIFGAGNAMFERCEIVSRLRSASKKQGYIAAPSTLIGQEYGLTFFRCRLTREKRVPANSVSLGRAWRPTTTFPDGRYGNPNAVGMAVYVRCWMDEHIERVGWDAMTYGARDGSRVELLPENARFFEYASRGPGAHVDSQRRTLTKDDVTRFELARILYGWIP